MPRRTTLKHEYFSWLYNLIRHPRSKAYYTKLCMVMHETNFRAYVPNDDNRAQDGLDLRQLFIEEGRLDESHLEVQYFLKGECTFFEMLVALSRRMNDLTYDLISDQDKAHVWFYKILANTGLDKFDDSSSRYPELGPVQEAEVCDTLCAILDRTYDKSGTGSLFPLKRRHPQDMRETEIWYQLMLWLDENNGL